MAFARAGIGRAQLTLLATLTLFALPVALAPPAWAIWPSNHNDAVPVCQAASAQTKPVVCSDGDGGMFIAWEDTRFASSSYIYVMRVLANGDLAPGWPLWGTPIGLIGFFQFDPAICSDGAGGAIVTWRDNRSGAYDVFAQRINSAGSTQWTTNGVQLCNAANTQRVPKIAPDNGGAFIVWEDQRNGANFDIYGQRVTSAGALAAGWGGLTGKAIETGAGHHTAPRIANDGTGGVLIAYYDASFSAYVRRVTAGGTVSGSPWGTVYLGSDYDFVPDGQGGLLNGYANGTYIQYQRIDPTGNSQWSTGTSATGDGVSYLRMVSDGVGGALMSWDQGIAGTRMLRFGLGGAVAPGWPGPGGKMILTQVGGTDRVLVGNGARGALYVYSAAINGPGKDIWAHHFDYEGQHVVEWPNPTTPGLNGGLALSLAPLDQQQVDAVSDGVGGALAAWSDQRGGAGNDDIYAQRIDFFGQLGYPEPKILDIRDVKNDQGGQVRIRWAASYVDSVLRLVETYSVWRQVPTIAQAVLRPDRAVLASSPADARERARALAEAGSSQHVLLPEATAAGVVFWEFLASLEAHGNGTYSYVAPTTSDSTAAGNPYTIFRVDAVDPRIEGYPNPPRENIAWWRSKPDSGYAVDNLAPAAPAPFAGYYSSGTATLHWRPNTEPDLAGYRLYRGATADFTADGGSLIATPSDTAEVDVAGAPYYYKVSATDVHGNESPTTTLLPSGALGVEVEGTGLSLATVVPNPLSNRATFRFRLSRSGPARLTLHDIQGRQVRTLLDSPNASEIQAIEWDGADATGRRVAPGVYVLRLAAEGRVLSRKALVSR